MKILVPIISILTIVYISIVVHSAPYSFTPLEKPVLLKETEDKFNQKGMNLHGNVFSVVTKQVYVKKEFGEIIPTSYEPIDSIIFDEHGRITEKYYIPELMRMDYYDNVLYNDQPQYINRLLYKYDTDKIFEIKQHWWEDRWNSNDTILFKRETDDNGRLIRETVYQHGKPVNRISFIYTPTGYKVEYYPEINKEADTYELTNYTMTAKTSMTSEVRKYNKDEKPIIYTGSYIIDFGYKWEYNDYGDLINGDGHTYTYKYDTNGNWTSKEWENGWNIRKITYMTKEEREAFKAQKRAREKAVKDSLYTRAVSLLEEDANDRVSYVLMRRRYRPNFRSLNKTTSVTTNIDGSYNITMGSGVELQNLTFSLLKDSKSFDGYFRDEYIKDFFITPDGKTALAFEFPKWFVLHFKTDIEEARETANSWIEASKADTVAMLNIGLDKIVPGAICSRIYYKLMDVCNQYDNSIKEINYIPYDVAAEMKYPKEFVESEDLRKQLRKYAEYALILKALKYVDFDEKNKPNASKVKKWIINDDGSYCFTFKDKEQIYNNSFNFIDCINNPLFDESLKQKCQLMDIYSGGISLDKKFVLFPVKRFDKGKIFNFLIEFDNQGEFIASYYFEEKIKKNKDYHLSPVIQPMVNTKTY